VAKNAVDKTFTRDTPTGAWTSRADLAPANTVAPVVSGDPTEGETLSCTTGTWTNSPSGYAYQWLRDDVEISGATSSTYDLVFADIDAMVSCEVTATNAGGSVAQESNEVGPVDAAEVVTGISSVSGTISSGQSLTIAGGGFGTKSTPAPILWDDFQSATVGSNLPGRSPPVGAAGAYQRINPSGVSSIPTISDTRSYSGDRCAFQRYTAGQEVFPKLANSVGTIDSVYIAFWAYYTRYTGTGSFGIFKWNRAGGGPDPYTANPRFYETIRPNSSGIVTAIDRGYLNGGGTTWDQAAPGYNAANEPDSDGWHFIEYWYKLSTPGVANGKFHKWSDGLQCSALGDNEMTRQSGTTGQIQYVISCFDGMSSPPATTGIDLFMDNYWIDVTPQRVVVGNASTWAACTRKDPQPAASWGATSIGVTANLPNYSPGNTVYFYVVDADNVPVSTNGFPKVVA
jgi:hypothetical protein